MPTQHTSTSTQEAMLILLVAMAAILATVLIAGGRLSRLVDLEFRWGGLLFLALVLQVLVISVFPRANQALLAALHLASYALAGAVVVVNRRVGGVLIIGLGGLLNLTAIVANGGVMPASPEATATAGMGSAAASGFMNSRMLDDPNLGFLGDVFALPQSWAIHNVFSIGDVLIVVGIAVLLHAACGSRLSRFRASQHLS